MSRLIDYTIHLADNALILGHRNSEWCGHGPVLEQDIAITNISLDLIGQARNFYHYAALLKADGSTEDTLAYLRDAHEFKNCLLVELPKGDWAITVLRQFLFSNYQYLLYQQLQTNSDEQVAAIATKALKEVTYHLRWSSEWVIRLGDGTEESHRRLEKALTELWPYTGELFLPASYEKETGIDLSSIKNEWTEKVNEIFGAATLPSPVLAGEARHDERSKVNQPPGKEGNHSEHLDAILSELQHLQRAYPGSEW